MRLGIELIVSLVALLCLELPALGQRRPVQIDNGYLHRTWQFEDGLPQNSVQAILQTTDGYIWVGTQKGLARFDGVRFTVFNQENTPSLKNAVFNALCETKDGSLWIATEGGGLNRFKDGAFSHYSKADGLSGDVVRALKEGKDGTLWIGTTTGLSQYKNGVFRSLEKEWGSEHVRSIGEASDGSLWICGANTGLHRFYNEAVVASFAQGNSRVPNSVRTTYTDRKGTLWIATMTGALEGLGEDSKLHTKTAGLADNVISTFYEDSDTNLWVGTYGGLNRMKDGKIYTVLNSDGQPYDAVFAICEDREGNLWIGTKDGLSRLRRRVFEAYGTPQGLGHNNVMSILQERKGRIWIGSWGGGLEQFRSGSVIPFFTRDNTNATFDATLMKSDLVLAVHQARDSSLWFGLDYNGGLYQYKDNVLVRHDPEQKFITSAVRVIYEDRARNLWIGTRAALFRLKDGVFTKYTTAEGLAGNLVRAIWEDSKGRIWFGTSEGLSVMAGGKFSTFTKANGLSSSSITALYEDQDENLWIGTAGGGLIRHKNGRFKAYTTKQGLFNDDVYEILEDGSANLWMSCRFGIFRVSKKQLDALDRGELNILTSASFGKYEGLPTLECNAVAKPSGWKTRDGKLWFATTKGIAVVDPVETLKINELPPPVLVEKVVVGNKSFHPKTISKLPPGRRDLEFHFTALSLSVPEKNRFKYKLEGFDEDWIDAGSRRVAYYANLRPGQYAFHVIACNNDGVWNETGTAIPLYLSPHIYESSFFYLACFGAMAALIFGIYRYRARQWKERQEELKALVDERTQHLQKEIAERKRVEAENLSVHKQLIDASRKAGMAEVASGVLHNVGNVLNSVNVSATLVMNSIRSSRASNLKKVTTLLHNERDHLGDFFTKDERGKQLPGYLTKLSEHLMEEQEAAVKELGALCKNVDHIKDIVSMQQAYAKFSGVVESLLLSDLLEDAVRVHATALSRHNVQLTREYKADPTIYTEKHKVIQILINLIANAKNACDEKPSINKEVTLRTDVVGPGRVTITVSDNGIGIPSENLTRIFSHGFTTRREGHGFGLHSAALAAKELGGSLSAYSQGIGMGARFVLEIPTNPTAGAV